MGVNVDKASAGTFKTIIGVFALLFIVMAGLTAFLLVRKPAAAKPRTKTVAAAKAGPPDLGTRRTKKAGSRKKTD